MNNIISDLGLELDTLIDKFGLPAVVDVLQQACKYRSEGIIRNATNDMSSLAIKRYWKKCSDTLENAHAKITDEPMGAEANKMYGYKETVDKVKLRGQSIDSGYYDI